MHAIQGIRLMASLKCATSTTAKQIDKINKDNKKKINIPQEILYLQTNRAVITLHKQSSTSITTSVSQKPPVRLKKK